MSNKQKTIKSEVSISGVGLHTGEKVNLTFKPAKENTGIIFIRKDLDNAKVKADIDNVFDTSRGTSLKENNVEARTVEHVLAAIAGLMIDNIIIELESPETPILDGSSQPYVDVLLKAGIEEQKTGKNYLELKENVYFSDPEQKTELIAIPDDHYSLNVMIDYETKVLSSQNAYLNNIEDFNAEIAKSRTFVFLHELEYLVKNNLIKGGDINNAIVFVNRLVSDDELSRLAKIFQRPKVNVKEEGILNNVDLYFYNEPARHKLLDVVGDLALLGMPLKAKIIASRPGHKSNVEFAKLLKKKIQKKQKNEVPQFDTLNPLYDINKIKEILPHRPPFLLIDKILEMSKTHVVGMKNVSMNEPYFVGHFPKEPVMPGVLQVEAMAQAGGVLALNSVPDPDNYLTYFLKIDKVRFKRKVIPGDTLIFKLDLISPMRRGIVHMKGNGYVGDKVVIEAEMMAQIIKKNK